MMNIEELQRRKNEIIEELQEIQTLRRGTLKEQYLRVPRKEKEPSMRGPYYVLARNENGRTVSVRINSAEELESVKKDIKAYKKFTNLSKEFISVTESITDVLRGKNIMDAKKNRKCTRKNSTVK